MSKLKELIDRLCPNGVEFKPLWELTIWDKKFNGVDRSKQPKIISYPYLLAKDMKALEQDGGDVTLLSTGEYVGHTTEELAGDFLCEGEVVTIPWGGTVKGMKYFKGKFVTADNRIATSADTRILNNKFLYYIFLKQSDIIQSFYRGAGIQHPNMNEVLHMLIPVPPIEVQEEIVRILDTFSAQAAELQAELQARKEQYEYYRNLLLTFNPSACGCGTDDEQEIKVTTWGGASYEIAWKTLGEIAELVTSRVNACDINSYVGVENLLKDKAGANPTSEFPIGDSFIGFSPNDILIGNIRPYLKKIWFADRNGGTNGDVLTIKLISSDLNPRFLYHVLATDLFFLYHNQYAKGAKMPRGDKNMVMNYAIPIPPLELQEKIVSILDRFESLVNDLTQGLPAELAAVKEQYEYYRNKLLTFPPIA